MARREDDAFLDDKSGAHLPVPPSDLSDERKIASAEGDHAGLGPIRVLRRSGYIAHAHRRHVVLGHMDNQDARSASAG